MGKWKILGILALINVISWTAVYKTAEPRFLEVTFFNVGQGDSVFIETPKGSQILIDGGPDYSVLEKLGREMPFWDKSLDLIILTHQDRDHLGGLIPVFKNYQVQNVIWTGAEKESSDFKEWKNLLLKEGAQIIYAKAGQKIVFQKGYIEILFPFDSFEGKTEENSNKTSIVSRLIFGENSFLFTGDIPAVQEKEILKGHSDLEADFYKVSHHGSKYSNHPEFIEKINPRISVISVGENSYNLPSTEVLDILLDYGIKVLRTDEDGDIKFFLNENDFRIINN